MRKYSEPWGYCACAVSVDCHCREPEVKSVGKPDAGNRHVRFDERGQETGRRFGVSARARPRLYHSTRLPTDVAQALVPAVSRVQTGHIRYTMCRAHRKHFWAETFIQEVCPGRNTVCGKNDFGLLRNGTVRTGPWRSCAGFWE